jgi:hypothetical protein
LFVNSEARVTCGLRKSRFVSLLRDFEFRWDREKESNQW